LWCSFCFYTPNKRVSLAASSLAPTLFQLFLDLRDYPCTHGLAALPDGKAEFLLEGDGGDESHGEGHVVPGHDHLHPVGQLGNAGDVRRPKVELGSIAGEEGGMTAT